MRLNLPWPVQYAMRALTGAGFQAYIVGGSVRDALLGKEPSDYDITTSATPDEVRAVFRRDRLVLGGLKHGTVTLIKRGMPVEITAFHLGGDDPDDDAALTGNLYEDVQRRDFTVNALCWNEQAGLIDYTGGEEDIEGRLIRSVMEPQASFREDVARILRGLRLSATLDFDIDPPTARAIHDNCAGLSALPVERVLMELKKLLCGPRAEAVLVEYRDAFEVVMPELASLTAGEYLLAARRVSLVSPAPELRLAALMGDLSREAAEACALRMRFSRVSRKFIDGAIEHAHEPMPTDRAGMRRAMNRYGDELLPGLVELHSARVQALLHMVIQENDCVSLDQLALTAEDVHRLGVTRRRIPECMNGLLERVMDGELKNTAEALGEAVRAGLEEQGERPARRTRRRRKSSGDAASEA